MRFEKHKLCLPNRLAKYEHHSTLNTRASLPTHSLAFVTRNSHTKTLVFLFSSSCCSLSLYLSVNSVLQVNSAWSSQPRPVDRTNTVSHRESTASTSTITLQINSLLYRQATLESPCYQPSPHHRHPYHSVSPTTSPQSPRPCQDRTVTFASPPSQVEIVPRVQILEFSPSPSLASDCSTDTDTP